MAKIKNVEDNGEVKIVTPQEQALKFLKANKSDHYNFEEEFYYKVKNSSLSMIAGLHGGLSTGAHRFIGNSAGGKTSCSLDFMYHFLLNNKGRKGVYIKSEGRLSPEVKARSGITFVTDPTQWEDGTAFVLESNVYETVFAFIGELIRDNPTKTQYFIVIDSIDMMAKRDDLSKSLDESAQVAGGALLTSVFLKKTAVALAKRGHVCIFISQVRAAIKIDKYQKSDNNRQGNSSGGNALSHAGDLCLEFLHRNLDDIITENPNDRKSKVLGHYCKIKIIKSNDETYGKDIIYPIRYGRTNASSVWVERELVELMLSYEKLVRNGSWFTICDELLKEFSDLGIESPNKFQGMDNIYTWMEGNEKAKAYLYSVFSNILS